MSQWSTDDVRVRIREFQRTLRRTVEVVRGSSITADEYDPFEHGPVVSFSGLHGYEEEERYWVNAPFAFVSINYDDVENEHIYYVVEPELDDLETELLEKLFADIRDALIHRRDASEATSDDPHSRDAEEVLKDELRELLSVYGVEVDVASFYRLFYYLYREFRGFGKLDPLMHDPHIEDISCDGYDLPLFVYHDEYTDIETNVAYEQEELDNLVVRLAQQSGRHVSIGDPVVETTLPDGSRAELALGEEVTPRG